MSAPGIDGGAGRQIYIVGTNGNGITGWTLSGAGDIYLHRSPEIGNAIGSTFNFAQSGNVYLDLSVGIGGGQSGDHATISQAFATTPSTSYALSFFVGAAFAPLASIHVSVTGASRLVDATLTAPAPSSTINWGLQTFMFTADSTSTTLRFRDLSGSDDNASFVDSVSVVESTSVPEIDPAGMGSVLALVGCWLGTLERRHRRKT